MTTQEQLTQVFYDNFIAYFRSHIAHINIVGRTFQSDHALLGGIYDELQDQIDTIGELLRSLQEMAPDNLDLVLERSNIAPTPMLGTSDMMLADVQANLEDLKGTYEELIKIATEEGHDEIANYAQDRVLSLAKHIWMLRSTLE